MLLANRFAMSNHLLNSDFDLIIILFFIHFPPKIS